MDNNMNISNLERLDTPTSWAWDFNYLGQKVWMVSERDEFGDSVEDKNGEMVSKPLWCTRIFVGEQELQSHYGSRKWDAWENRVGHLRSVYDIVSEVSPAVEKAQKKVAKVKEKVSGLNEKELLVLERLVWDASNQGGDFGFTDDVISENYASLKMSKPEVKGYIGSIKKKGLIWIDTTDYGYQQFGFTDEGWKVLSELGPKYLMC
jgi:hypothetical protein